MIREAAARLLRLTGQTGEALRGKEAPPVSGMLTRREFQVLHAISWGLTTREIGQRLSISPRTVEVHRGKVLTKLGARTSAEAVRIALMHDVEIRDPFITDKPA